MANVSYLRPATSGRERGRGGRGRSYPAGRPPRRARYVVGGLLLAVLAALGAAAVVLASSSASLSGDPSALAKVTMPLGGGTVQSVEAVEGPQQAPVPVAVRNDPRVWPLKQIPAGQRVQLWVTIKRPGFISWLTGSTERLHLTLTAPAASLTSHFVTVAHGAPVRLTFKAPITRYGFGEPGHMHVVTLSRPASSITLPRTAEAGTVSVWAAPRSWERAHAAAVSWFPAGSGATAVASPAPGATIHSDTPITLTLSRPVSKVFGSHLPPVLPDTAGTWHRLGTHAIVFKPTGYGYGLAATVTIPLPQSVHLVGSEHGSTGSWKVPGGSTQRLQQLLATLGYLPLKVHYAGGAGVPLTYAAQEAAAVKAPAAHYSWRYPNTPGWLVGQWQPGSFGEITKAAIMAFENTEGMTADGVPGPDVWKALITAVIRHQNNTFGYTVVDVSEGSPETETTWHNGHTVASGLVNTGVASMPTAQGTFAVFEHAPSVTMSGTNPDGSHYVDPGIPWVSYFNGGDALHGFIRGGYGYPQSDGCVEMPYSEAHQVYPYTPIGTIVHVS